MEKFYRDNTKTPRKWQIEANRHITMKSLGINSIDELNEAIKKEL